MQKKIDHTHLQAMEIAYSVMAIYKHKDDDLNNSSSMCWFAEKKVENVAMMKYMDDKMTF